MDDLAQFIPLILIITVVVVWSKLAKKKRIKELTQEIRDLEDLMGEEE